MGRSTSPQAATTRPEGSRTAAAPRWWLSTASPRKTSTRTGLGLAMPPMCHPGDRLARAGGHAMYGPMKIDLLASGCVLAAALALLQLASAVAQGSFGTSIGTFN